MILGSVPLVKYGPKPKVRPLRNLLTGKSSANLTAATEERSRSSSATPKGPHRGPSKSRSEGDRYISFWKPEVGLRGVGDSIGGPRAMCLDWS